MSEFGVDMMNGLPGQGLSTPFGIPRPRRPDTMQGGNASHEGGTVAPDHYEPVIEPAAYKTKADKVLQAQGPDPEGPITASTMIIPRRAQSTIEARHATRSHETGPARIARTGRYSIIAAGILSVSLAIGGATGGIGALVHRLDGNAASGEASVRKDTYLDVNAKKVTVNLASKEAPAPKDLVKSPDQLVAYATNPDVDVAQLADLIVTQHHISSLDIRGSMPVKQYVANTVDDLVDITVVKNITSQQMGTIKTTLAFAYAFSNYPQLADMLSDPERKVLSTLMPTLDEGTLSANMQQFGAALTNILNKDTSYTTDTKQMMAELLGIAKTAAEAAPDTQPTASASPTETVTDPSAYYAPTAADIAKLFPGAKQQVIEKQLPVLLAALHKHKLDKDPRVLAYIFATIRVENGEFDSRVKEYGAGPQKPYWPYIGGGLSELTWSTNYLKYGNLIGVDLLHHPELIHRMDIDSEVVALFQKEHLASIMRAVSSGNLAAARRGYNGGTSGLGMLERTYVKALALFNQRLISPAPLPVSHIQLESGLVVPSSWQMPKLPDNCDPVNAQGYTPVLQHIADVLQQQWGPLNLGGVIAPTDAKNGHGDTSDHYTGHAVDIMLDPSRDISNLQKQQKIANWLVQHALELNIHYLIVNNQIWNIDPAYRSKGWRLYDPKYNNPTTKTEYTLGHDDHIHISTFLSQNADGSRVSPSAAFPFHEAGAVCPA